MYIKLDPLFVTATLRASCKNQSLTLFEITCGFVKSTYNKAVMK